MIGFLIKKYFVENGKFSKFSERQSNPEIFDSDLNQIKIQFVALGLIDVQASTAQSGGIQEFASLTPKGRQRLLDLLAVRGTTQRAPEEE
jgi:hypothetical protein